MRIVTPLRFVPGVIGLWVVARVMVLAADMSGEDATPPASARTAAVRPEPAPRVARVEQDIPSTDLPLPVARAMPPAGRPVPGRIASASPPRQAAHLPHPPAAAAATSTLSPAGIVSPYDRAREPAMADSGRTAATPGARPGAAAGSRWSGSLYLFRRGDGDTALATGGQLGGSQAGGRIAYRLNRTGPTRIAAAARLSTPLDDGHGAEAAVGVDWHPLPARPLRLSIERRIDLGGAARNAWSAYGAGGFYRESAGGVVLDGYAQAGVVGAKRRDLFADGALRTGLRRPLGDARSLTIGAGAWGAAQPGVARLDIGPRAALGLPIGGANATLAAEWRIRVAGQARPGTGLAVTLAADF